MLRGILRTFYFEDKKKYPGSSLGSLFVGPKRRNPKEKCFLSLGALKVGVG